MIRGLALFVVLSAMAPAVQAAPTPEPGAIVQIQNNYFDPATVHVDAGGTIIWFARSGGHTVTSEDGSFSSAPLRSGEIIAFAFEVPGSYPYKCVVHQPRMAGVIEVG